MKPVFVPHSSYQSFVLEQLRLNYGPGIVIVNKDWPLVLKLWNTNLSHLTTMLQPVYSDRGPEPRDPASMFRSFLVLLMTNPGMGVTEWINEMVRTPIYALPDCSGIWPASAPPVMAHRLSPQPIPGANPLAIVVPAV